MVPVLVPRASTRGSAVTVRVRPETGSVPDDGVIVSHGLSDVAVNCTGEVEPGTNTVCTMTSSPPISALALPVRGGVMNTPTTSEYGPRSPLPQLLTPRTR